MSKDSVFSSAVFVTRFFSPIELGHVEAANCIWQLFAPVDIVLFGDVSPGIEQSLS